VGAVWLLYHILWTAIPKTIVALVVALVDIGVFAYSVAVNLTIEWE
jgi:hypothetical protein